MEVIVYSKPACGYCVMAKNLLKSKGIEYEERYLNNPQAIQEFIAEHPTKRTMPFSKKSSTSLLNILD